MSYYCPITDSVGRFYITEEDIERVVNSPLYQEHGKGLWTGKDNGDELFFIETDFRCTSLWDLQLGDDILWEYYSGVIETMESVSELKKIR